MNYLVIDLEMCNVPRDYRSRSYKYANETIQIGAVLLDEEFKRIGTLTEKSTGEVYEIKYRRSDKKFSIYKKDGSATVYANLEDTFNALK